MTLQEAIKTTQEQVVALAKSIQEDQKPAYYDEVIGSACLSAKCNSGRAAAASSLVPPVASAPAISPSPADEAAWQRIAASIDPLDFESFARIFPDSAHRAEAETRTKELRQKAELKVAALPPKAVATPPEIGSEAGTAILYEEPLKGTSDGSPAAAIPGTIAWNFVPAGANGAEVEAIVDVPGRSFQARLEFQKNSDTSLPASHLINVTFSLPADFPGKGISYLDRVIMKKTEQGSGQPLSGLAVKVTNGFFLVGLSPADVKKNLALLGQNDWVDLTLDYETGQRAILTLAKGPLGKRAFEQAFAAWSSPSAVSAHGG